MDSRDFFDKPTLIRFMVAIAVLVLPAAAWVDYRQGFFFAASIEGVAAVTLLVLSLLVGTLGPQRAAKIALLVTFALAVAGSVEKLDSMPNYAWLTVLPFLYVSIGGVGLGCLLSACHFGIMVFCLWRFGADVVAAYEPGTWAQVCLAYLTAVGIAVSYERLQNRLKSGLQKLAEQDPLTGLLNRRGMEKRLRELTAFLRRHDVVVVMALFDVDHFKRTNDIHGHDVGDTLLVEVSRRLQSIFRASDCLARWGGDEFLVALTRTSFEDATVVLERVRTEIAAIKLLDLPPVTLSIGAAEWQPGMDLDAALKQADQALYAAKEQGRNTISSAAKSEASQHSTHHHSFRPA